MNKIIKTQRIDQIEDEHDLYCNTVSKLIGNAMKTSSAVYSISVDGIADGGTRIVIELDCPDYEDVRALRTETIHYADMKVDAVGKVEWQK